MVTKVHRVELAGSSTARNSDYDSYRYFINCYPETLGEREKHVVKRPGHGAASFDLSEEGLTTEEARGCYYWNGNVYHVWGDRLYRGATEIGTDALTQTTGKVYFTPSDDNTLLYIHEYGASNQLHSVNASDTFSTCADTTFTDMTTEPGLVQIDGFTVVLEDDQTISHSNLNDAMDSDSWAADATLVASLQGDEPMALARHINYVMYLGSKTIEFFQNAGNTTGSTLGRLKGTGVLIGCAAPEAVVNIERSVFWIAQAHGGGRFVAALEGLQPISISTKPVEEALDAEGDITDAYGYTFRIGAHSFYCFHLPGQDQTWAYNITESTWVQFRSGTSGGWHVFDACAGGGTVYVQSSVAGSGDIFALSTTTYQDDGSAINIEGGTYRWDGEDRSQTVEGKVIDRLNVIADQTSSTSDLSIAWSDDDHQNFSTNRTADLNNEVPFLTRLGSCKRRNFRYQHSANTSMRLASFELKYSTYSTYGL